MAKLPALPSGNPLMRPADSTPGSRLDRGEDIALVVEAASPRPRIGGEGAGHVEDERVGGAVAGIDGEHAGEAAGEKAGADEQHDGQRDLRHDQGLSRPFPLAAGHRPLPLVEPFAQPGRRRPRRGDQAEHHGRDDRDAEREREDAAVDRDGAHPRQVWRLQRDERPHPGERDQRAERAGGEREHQRLGQQLADDAPAAGADREAQRELAVPGRGAREIQVRDVEAGDRQQQDRGAEEDQQDRPARGRQVIAKGHGGAVEHPGAVAVTGLHRLRQGADFIVRGADLDVAADTGDGLEVVRRAATSAALLFPPLPLAGEGWGEGVSCST